MTEAGDPPTAGDLTARETREPSPSSGARAGE
jgi:hypothetical protein